MKRKIDRLLYRTPWLSLLLLVIFYSIFAVTRQAQFNGVDSFTGFSTVFMVLSFLMVIVHPIACVIYRRGLSGLRKWLFIFTSGVCLAWLTFTVCCFVVIVFG